MNKILIVGRLTKDPESNFTQNSNKLVKFTLACDKRKKDAGADFFIVNAWNNTADIIEKYCKKGSRVFISGRMESREYKIPNGESKKVWEIQAEDVELLGNDRTQEGNDLTKDFTEANDLESDFGEDVPF